MKLGKPVRFAGAIVVPPGAGSVVAAEWDSWRGTSQRQGDRATPYTRIQNLGRVRVVVR